MNILLVHPLPPDSDVAGLIDNLPLGLAYIGTYLENFGHKVKIIDIWADRVAKGTLGTVGYSDVLEEIKEFSPHIVGVSIMFKKNQSRGKDIAKLIKSYNFSIPVIIGGPDATQRYSVYLQDPHIDMVVCGEGEHTFQQVIDYYQTHGKLPKDIKGTVVVADQVRTAASPIKLDELPFPNYDLLRSDLYFCKKRSYVMMAKRLPTAIMISSRGCNLSCTFCGTKDVWGGFRFRSVANTIDEIKRLQSRYGVRNVEFMDDNFFLNYRRAMEFCNELVREKIDITWDVNSGVVVKNITRDLLHAMKESGYYRVTLPIESGDPETQKSIKKIVNLDHARQVIEWCHELGLWTNAFFVIGFPEESMSSIQKTYDFVLTSKLDKVEIFQYQPYMNTPLYKRMNDLQLLQDFDDSNSDEKGTTFNTKYFLAHEVRELASNLKKEFAQHRNEWMSSPAGRKIIIKKMSTWEDFCYGVRLLSRWQFPIFSKNSLTKKFLTNHAANLKSGIVLQNSLS